MTDRVWDDPMEAMAQAAYEQWTANHARPLPWSELPPYTQHKYRRVAAAVMDVLMEPVVEIAPRRKSRCVRPMITKVG